MTRQEIKQMLAKNAKEIYCGEDKTVYNEKGLCAIEDAIIARQDERLKEFVEWCLKNYDEQIEVWKKVLKEVEYKDTAEQMLNDTKKKNQNLLLTIKSFWRRRENELLL